MGGIIKKPLTGKLNTRFNVSQNEGQLTLGDTVIPVTLVDEHTKITKRYRTTGTATARTDTYTVPVSKRWTLITATLGRSNAAISEGFIDLDDGGGNTYAYYTGASETSSRATTEIRGVTLTAGQKFIWTANTATSGTITTDIIVLEEDF